MKVLLAPSGFPAEQMRDAIHLAMNKAGYGAVPILLAHTFDDALDLWAQHKSDLDAVVTDGAGEQGSLTPFIMSLRERDPVVPVYVMAPFPSTWMKQNKELVPYVLPVERACPEVVALFEAKYGVRIPKALQEQRGCCAETKILVLPAPKNFSFFKSSLEKLDRKFYVSSKIAPHEIGELFGLGTDAINLPKLMFIDHKLLDTFACGLSMRFGSVGETFLATVPTIVLNVPNNKPDLGVKQKLNVVYVLSTKEFPSEDGLAAFVKARDISEKDDDGKVNELTFKRALARVRAGKSLPVCAGARQRFGIPFFSNGL